MKLPIPVNRTILSYNVAGKVIAGFASNWYKPVYAEICSEGSDMLTKIEYYHRSPCMEQPWQLLDINIGGFVQVIGGALAEIKACYEIGWPKEMFSYPLSHGSKGKPYWLGLLFNCQSQLEAPRVAYARLHDAFAILGVDKIGYRAEREMHLCAQETIISCWKEIEVLAADLEKYGRIDDLSTYWNKPPLDLVIQLTLKWCNRYRKVSESAADLASYLNRVYA
jgi:hypothetical protein